MKIEFINFNNLKLDFSNNYCNNVTFTYGNNNYSVYVYLVGADIYIYQPSFVIAKVEINKIIKTTSIDLVFCAEDFSNNNNLSIDNIFKQYKLGVISYV